MVGGETLRRGEYDTVVKSLSEVKKLKPIEQLEFLLSVVETAGADAWYAQFSAEKILGDIADSGDFSPLLRIVAVSTRNTMLNSSAYSEDDEHESKQEDYGYDSIVTPDMMPEGILTPEEESWDKEEIEARLKLVKEKLDQMSHVMFETGSEEETRFQSLYSEYCSLEYALHNLLLKENQVRLHEEFPALPRDEMLVKIASDAAAVVKFEKRYDEDESWFSFGSLFGEISDLDGHIISASETGNPFDLDQELITYLSIVHNNRAIKKLVEKTIGLSLVKIPLKSQVQLLRFMTEANGSRFDKLCSVLNNIGDEELRCKLLENFVAADFGEDFGDALLAITGSERLSNKEKAKVFETINSCRESIHKITALYSGMDDGRFMREYTRAANERLTDAIMVFSRISEKGMAGANLDWAGEAEFDFDLAIEALNYEARSLEIISGTLSDVMAGKRGAFAEVVMHPDSSNQRLQRTVYNFYSPSYGYVLLYTRPEGSHSFDPMVEYGKLRSRYDPNSVNAGVEASISLITNPVDPFSLPSPFRPDGRTVRNPRFYDPITMDKVSAIRLDREGRAPGMAADNPDRDPISSAGMVSVDLAAIGDRDDTPSGKIARLLSVGGKIREEDSGNRSSLNHNTRWFSQEKYGTAEGFRALVRYMDEMALEWCAKHGPEGGDKSFTRLIKMARGRKTREVA